MATQTFSQFLEKIDFLERALQRLKIEAYFSLPLKQRKELYPEKSLRKAIKSLRRSIWQERYEKKIKDLS